MTPVDQYTATATAKGAGRAGHVKCNGLKLDLALPKEMGGDGKGENPEQLFAMGYSGACILHSYSLSCWCLMLVQVAF